MVMKGHYECTFTILIWRGWGNKGCKILIVKIYLLLIYYLYDLLEYVFTEYSCCLYINEKYILS